MKEMKKNYLKRAKTNTRASGEEWLSCIQVIPHTPHTTHKKKREKEFYFFKKKSLTLLLSKLKPKPLLIGLNGCPITK